MRLHYGCGAHKLEGYLNVDVRPEVKPDQLMDISIRWAFPDAHFDEVVSYHVIEHLTKAEAAHVLRETTRVLKPGGKLVLECPDVKQTAKEFAEGNDYRINNLYGLQRNPFDFHRFGYWPEQMKKMLEYEYGFKVTHLGPGTDYHASQEPCMRVEAKKL